jgi:acetyl/propionyl-CoA carboxylase alpha subunit
MKFNRLLIANRGEIAIRLARAAAEMGIATVAVYSKDDQYSRHVLAADEAVCLTGIGARAYLDAEQIIQVALSTGCEAIHPGYGFLSENADFAALCVENGINFVGPSAELLALLGDKAQALNLAAQLDIPILAGSGAACTLAGAQQFFAQLPAGSAMMIKAIAGGGGRGMRIVKAAEGIAEAFSRCQGEALSAFGNDNIYVEEFLPKARHIEVQIIGDGYGGISHLGERECTLQRSQQKLIEVAPSPTLTENMRQNIINAAVRMAAAVTYRSLGTFEFLLDAEHEKRFYFIEVNPRLQVEHTVTEEVTGIDLVKTQLQLAQGETLTSLGFTQQNIPAPRGYAMQLRINMEQRDQDGRVQPSVGMLRLFELPGGPGVRVDTFGYTGYTVNPLFDSLLAKLIVSYPQADFAQLIARAARALSEFRIEGVETSISVLQNLLADKDVIANKVHTRFVDEHRHLAAITPSQKRHFDALPLIENVLSKASDIHVPEDCRNLAAVMNGTIVEILVKPGDSVQLGQELAIIEAMKMQYAISAPGNAIVLAVNVSSDELVSRGQSIFFITETDAEEVVDDGTAALDLDLLRADLAEVLQRQRLTLDSARPQAVAKRHKQGMRTARENIDDLCDADSFIEYGALTFAAQKARRSVDDLIRHTPADGLVAGIGSVNGADCSKEQSRCMVLAYDYTVLAGTQGTMNHRKTDRVLALAEQYRLPIVLFAEGGGGRPGDTDNATKVAGLDVPTFQRYAKLSGLVPRIAIVAGRCFAGNAAMAGCSDIIIGTAGSSLGMGGPAMIEGGGLGVYHPDEVGPVSMQEPNGVLDLVAVDEREAVKYTKQLLSFFQGDTKNWQCADQRLLRWSIPENRLRAYDIRKLIAVLADTDSVLELRAAFAPAMMTAFIRIEGRAMGLIANVPVHDGGAIDAQAADKAARFMQLCDAFDIPLLSLCDTPGFLVGPQAEATGLVRHTSRMFVTVASLSVPVFTIVLRKGYGLGAMAMAAGGFHSTAFTVAWPTGEFGGMGLEGGVRLGFRKELDALDDPVQREALYDELVAAAYQRGKALSTAVSLEIDAVIDPLESRRWIISGLNAMPAPTPREGRKRPFVDTW